MVLNKKKNWCSSGNETGGFFYFLGFIGALAFYWTTATNLWEGVIGFFKAIVWPAFLVYGAMMYMYAMQAAGG